MSSLCIIDKSIKWILMFFPHCNQLDQNRTIYVCFFMLHILLLAVISEKLCMFLYNLTVVTSQKLTVKAKNTMILPTNSLKFITSIFSRFWLTTYLLGVFFTESRNSYVHQLCSHFANLFLSSYEEDIKKIIEASPILWFNFPLNRLLLCWSHLSYWAWSKGCHWYSYVCFIPFDLHLEIDSVSQLRRKLYDKRDDFKITIENLPFICSNIPATPRLGVFISQLIQYSRTCQSYRDFLHIW
jgi:hypothetical protein